MSSHSLHVCTYTPIAVLDWYLIVSNGNASVIQYSLIFEVVKLRKSRCATHVRLLHMPNIYTLDSHQIGLVCTAGQFLFNFASRIKY